MTTSMLNSTIILIQSATMSVAATSPTVSVCGNSNHNHNNVNQHNDSNSPLGNGSSFFLPAHDPFKEQVIISLAIIRLCLAVFGCLANVVAAVVLTNRKLWSPTSMLLLSLVIYDAFYLMLMIPVGATSISVNIHFTPSRYSTLRTIMALCFPLRSMAQMASTYTTVTVTVERYLVILLPLKASSMWTYGKTRRAIIGVLLFSVLFNLPRCFDHILSQPPDLSESSSTSSDVSLSSKASSLSSSSILNDDSNGTTWHNRAPESVYMGLVSADGSDVIGNASCLGMRGEVDKSGSGSVTGLISKDSDDASVNVTETVVSRRDKSSSGKSVLRGVYYFYRVVYLFYLTVIFLYLIPYTLIPVLNLQLILALRRRKEETRRISIKNEHRLNVSGAAHSPTEKEDGLTYIVFGITFCYFICCILPAVYILYAIASDNSNDSTSIYILNAGETTLVINAATDFFFYCLLGRKFRRVFVRTFCPQRYIKKTKAITMRSTFSYNSV